MRLSSSSPWGRPSTPASRDWARHGHATTRLTTIYRARAAPTGATSRGRRRFSRRVHRTAGTVALLVVALVSSGSVLALRGALFPDTGDETTRSIWRNPGRTAGAQIGPVVSATVVGGDLKPLSIPLVTAPRRDSTSVPSTTLPTRQTRQTATPAVETAPIDVSLGVGQTSRSASATIAVVATTLPGGNSTTTIDTTPEATGPTPTGPSSTGATTSNRPTGTAPSNTAPSTTEKAPAAPAPFSKTYTANGGLINISWTGSRLALDAVSPATGYRAEIEQNERDRIRVDFESDGAHSRIEIRFENGRIIVGIDND